MSTKISTKETKNAVVTKKLNSKTVIKPEEIFEEPEEEEEEDEEEEAEEVEELDENDVEAEVDAEAEAEAEEETTTEKKKSKKVEFNCESLEDALIELNRVHVDIEQLAKYHKAVFKTYQKLVTKQLKQSKKRRNHTSDTPKEATGFVKAIPIPSRFKSFYESHFMNDDEFNKLFGSFDVNKETPRTDITKMIYHYIRSNSLYGEKEDGTTDKRTIIPDKNIKSLLSINDDEHIGFSNFQSFVTRLYNSNIVDAVGAEESEDDHESAVEVIVSKSKASKKAVASV